MPVTGYPDWQPGGLALHGAVELQTNTHTLSVIPSTFTEATVNVYQTCYELFVSAANALPAGNASFLTIQCSWIDGNTGVELARRKWKIVSGPNGSPHTFKISGPVHADTLKMIFGIVSDSVHAITYTYHLFGTSRPYSRDVIRSLASTGDGFTVPGNNPDLGVLINTLPSVAGSGSLDRLMAAYNGQVHVGGFTSSGLGDASISIVEAFLSAPLLANTQTVDVIESDGKGNIDGYIQLPNVQCIARLNNNNAGLQSISCLIALGEVGP